MTLISVKTMIDSTLYEALYRKKPSRMSMARYIRRLIEQDVLSDADIESRREMEDGWDG